MRLSGVMLACLVVGLSGCHDGGSDNTATLGGTINGLSGVVTVTLNANESKQLTENGAFVFRTHLAAGDSYSVIVSSQPVNQTCTVAGGSGIVPNDFATNVAVTCAGHTYRVGGVVAGLSSGTVQLQNGTEVISVSSNGAFSFPTLTRVGGPYAVSVRTHPAGATCTVTNGSGTVGTSNVTNVAVSCQQNTHLVGGTVTGLIGTLTLINGSEIHTTSTDGSFSFASPVAEGATYSVSVDSQPATQTCSVSNGSGTMGTANVSNVNVVCSVNTFTVGGTVSGLLGSVVVENNGGDARTINGDGLFSFAAPVAQGGSYSVTIQSQPATQTCSVSNGSGIVGAGNVMNVTIACSTNAFTVGGTVSGLSGTLSLQNNGTDTITTSSSGAFTFPTPVAQGSPYNLTVLAQPAGQSCVIFNGSGMIGSSNVTNVGVTCTLNTTTLSAATTAAIEVNGTGTLVVTNTGTTVTATNIHAELPSGWLDVTQDASNCTALAPGASCTLSFSSNTPYVAQRGIQITADNVSSSPQVALAFSIGGYLVFSVDSASTATVADSVTQPGAPRWSSGGVATGASSLTDGAANTAAAVNSLGSDAEAAGTCYVSTAGGATVGTWYLPAVCQLTNAGGFASCAPGTPNIHDNLISLGFFTGIAANRSLWSSTENPTAPTVNVWYVVMARADPLDLVRSKINDASVHCARSMSY